MIVGIATLELYIPMAVSLKDKRSVIKSLIEKSRNKFNVAVAEVGNNDIWKNATIGIVTIGNQKRIAESILDSVIRFVEEIPELEVINRSREYL